MPTVITKSVGSAAGRDYPTIQAFWDAIPADLVAVDQAWVGEFYKDTEFTLAASLSFASKVTDSTRNIKLRPAAGQGFSDSANILTDPFFYSAARGVSFRGLNATNSTLLQFPSGYITVTGFQFSGGTSVIVGGGGPNFALVNSLVEQTASGQFSSAVSSAGGSARNTTVILKAAGSNGFVTNTTAFRCENVTVVRQSSFARGGNAFQSSGANAFTLVNCCAFNINFSNNSHLGSNNASDGTIPSGSGKLENLVFANQFVSTVNDFRTKGGSALINAGTAVSADNTQTISGSRVQGPAADIGAWELYVLATTILTSGADGSVGNANPITIALNGEITGSVTVTLAVTGGGTISPSSVTFTSAQSSATVQYTAASAGSKTFTTTNNGGFTNAPPLTLNFIVAPILSPTPSIAGRKVLKIGSGTGQDFPDLGAFAAFLSTQNPLAQKEMVIAEVYADQSIGTRALQYAVDASSMDYYVIIRPVKGLDVVSLNGVSTFNYGTSGIEIKVATDFKIGHGVVLEGFRIDCGTTGTLRIGGPQPGASVRSVTQTGYRRNRMKIAGGLAIGEYSAVGFVSDNLIIRETGTATIRTTVNAAEVSRNTFVALSGAQGSFISGDYNTKIENNVFINVGDTPISTNSPSVDNNYTNNALAATRTGIISITSTAFVVNAASDFIPIQNGPLIGNGSATSNSIVDNRLANRGIDPDVGAWQRVPAPPLPGILLAAQPSPKGQQLRIDFTTTDTPVSGTAFAMPAENNAGNAAFNTGTVTLASGSGFATFSDLAPGKYSFSIAVSNLGGTTAMTGVPEVTILEIGGSPAAMRSGDIPSSTAPSKPVNVIATPKFGGVSVSGTVLSNGGSVITEYTVTSSSTDSISSTTLPIFFAMADNAAATFVMVAKNAIGSSPQSDPSSPASPLPNNPLTAPTVPGISVVAGLASLTVSVTAPSSDGGSPVTSYTVILSTGETLTQAVGPFLFNSLNSTPRTAQAYATNMVGDGPLSDQSPVVTPIPIEEQPVILDQPIIGVAVAGNGFVDVYFLPPPTNTPDQITSYTAILSSGKSASNTSSPIRVPADNGVSVSAVVFASNQTVDGPSSDRSNVVTPEGEFYELYPYEPSVIVRYSSSERLRLSIAFVDAPAPKSRTVVVGGSSNSITSS